MASYCKVFPIIFIHHTVELDSIFSRYFIGALKKTESHALGLSVSLCLLGEKEKRNQQSKKLFD